MKPLTVAGMAINVLYFIFTTAHLFFASYCFYMNCNKVEKRRKFKYLSIITGLLTLYIFVFGNAIVPLMRENSYYE